ncbi:hypothetical protein ACOICT_29040, partial [Klebsiella pneumoniae]|uniref:hypothetical protein n=1 Tax=Klebsiella pneumoniae TaxID=573 RepID=UPI003B5CD55F
EPTITTSSMTGGKLPGTVRNSDTLVGEGPYTNNHFRFYATGLTYQLNDAWTFSTNYSYSSTRTRRNESVLTLRNGAGDYDDYRSDYGEAY